MIFQVKNIYLNLNEFTYIYKIKINLVKLKNDDSDEADELDEEWACGSDEVSSLIAESTIDRNCPLIKSCFFIFIKNFYFYFFRSNK